LAYYTNYINYWLSVGATWWLGVPEFVTSSLVQHLDNQQSTGNSHHQWQSLQLAILLKIPAILDPLSQLLRRHPATFKEYISPSWSAKASHPLKMSQVAQIRIKSNPNVDAAVLLV
jgi:hypothetical protein